MIINSLNTCLLPHGGATSEHIGVENTLLLTKQTFEGPHYAAKHLLEFVRAILDFLGLQDYPTLETALYSVFVILIAFISGAIIKWILLKIVNKLASKLDNELINSLRSVKFFTKLSRIIPPVIFLIMIQHTF